MVVVMVYNCSVNPIPNPNPVSSHLNTRQKYVGQYAIEILHEVINFFCSFCRGRKTLPCDNNTLQFSTNRFIVEALYISLLAFLWFSLFQINFWMSD
jgi:hypothetical protein